MGVKAFLDIAAEAKGMAVAPQHAKHGSAAPQHAKRDNAA